MVRTQHWLIFIVFSALKNFIYDKEFSSEHCEKYYYFSPAGVMPDLLQKTMKLPSKWFAVLELNAANITQLSSFNKYIQIITFIVQYNNLQNNNNRIICNSKIHPPHLIKTDSFLNPIYRKTYIQQYCI